MSDRIAADKFHFDGRGPELERAVWILVGHCCSPSITGMQTARFGTSASSRRRSRCSRQKRRWAILGRAALLISVVHRGFRVSPSSTSVDAAIFGFFSTTSCSTLFASLWSSPMEDSRQPPNHAVERTAARRAFTFRVISTVSLQAMRGPASRRSSCSR